MCGGCLKGVFRVSQRFLGVIYGMFKYYVRCLDVYEEQVRISQVRIGKVRTGQARCLEGVWQVSQECL